MKKPEPQIIPPFNYAMLDGLTAAELTELVSHASELRLKKLADAKRALIAEYRTKAAALGLDLDEIMTPNARPVPVGPSLPPDWKQRVIRYLEKSEGRAPSRALTKQVWSGLAPEGAKYMVARGLNQLVKQGVLLIIRPGTRDAHTIYGLASMIEMPQSDAA